MSMHDHHWTFGDKCHIEFQGGGDPVVVLDHAFKSDEGCASVSDSTGALLFYTDGQMLYDSSGAQINPTNQPLGGSSSCAHSVIVVPPAGGGSRYHIFAMHDWASVPSAAGPLTYSAVSVVGGVSLVSPPSKLTAFGPQLATERAAAISHVDCDKYWVVSLNEGASPDPGRIYSMLIDSDAAPSVGKTWSWAYPYATVAPGYWIAFSPDGALLAVSSKDSIDILTFDRATGAFGGHSQVTSIAKDDLVYGVAFSPNGRYLYFTGIKSGEVRRHTIGASGTTAAFGSTDLIGKVPSNGQECIGALQVGPNRKIYGAKVNQNTLFEIGDPDNPAAGSVLFKLDAVQADGSTLTLNRNASYGLPTFPRIATDCDACKTVAGRVDRTLAERSRLENSMATCNGEPPAPVQCHPLEIPPLQPQTYIHWGSSPCDCIEGDDTEIMYLTVCNPYSNLTLSNLTVHELVVVDDQGNAVPNLPDGTPSIQLVPIGPYCFDDIAPCTCVTREFILRLRGAPGNRKYRILVRGICFDACIHGDTEACFTFDVCKD